ncbi:MAG: RdgB/HAM1 family non-canonical purine NTP pyrophosphatase [Spirochaetales bacterium]|nr:RdgB/HAM1 family non-canonical purine NTP pyrophosphatase [Spirochaetales bacterium]
MKIEQIVIATNNAHKKDEIAAALSGTTVLLPGDFGISFNHEETGTAFVENAIGKALTLYKQVNKPVIADDSGICVPVLDGKPGIYSARFGSELQNPPQNDNERNSYLLSLLPAGGPHEAFFVCSMVLMLNEYRFFVVQETVHGELIHQPKGNKGFGYDPIFFIPELGKTAAELTMEIKNQYSHRGRAVKKIKSLIESEIEQKTLKNP